MQNGAAEVPGLEGIVEDFVAMLLCGDVDSQALLASLEAVVGDEERTMQIWSPVRAWCR